MIRKFRKKPVIVEAVQYRGGMRGNFSECCTFGVGGSVIFQMDLGGKNGIDGVRLLVRTPEGDMVANDGDWVVKNIKGEFHAVKDEIFKIVYEPVEEEQ